MSAAIVVTESVRVPAHAMTVHAVRASGPGGQNVQKVATKVDLRVELGAIEGLSEGARARLLALCRHRLDAEGRLMVTSQLTRNQARNVEDAREKVKRLVAAALREPRRRKKSRPPASSRWRPSVASRARAGSESPSIASRSTRSSTFVATFCTFWPPGPDARTACMVIACAGTRTAPVTTIASLMPAL